MPCGGSIASSPRRQAPALRPERQRPRRVDHHHLGARRRVGERAQQVRHAHALDRDVAVAREPRVDAEQEVFAFERQRVAGEINEGQRVGPACLDLGEEVAVGANEIRLAQIGAFDDFKADAAQRLGDESGVVERGRQRARAIAGVADDEGDARLGLLLGEQRRSAETDKRERAQREQTQSGAAWKPPRQPRRSRPICINENRPRL